MPFEVLGVELITHLALTPRTDSLIEGLHS